MDYENIERKIGLKHVLQQWLKGVSLIAPSPLQSANVAGSCRSIPEVPGFYRIYRPWLHRDVWVPNPGHLLINSRQVLWS